MKIAVISSHTPTLFRLRLDMMKDFIRNGHTVLALGSEPEDEWEGKFNENNIEYKQFFVERNGVNPIKDLRTLVSLYLIMKKEKPDKVFAYQAKPVVYGSIAAKLNGIHDVYLLIAGLGSIIRGEGFKNNVIKTILHVQYWAAFKCSRKVFFQNQDDKNEFVSNGLIKNHKTVIINGSGVNLENFKPTPFPDKPTFLFIGRLIKDKGILEYLEACKKVKEKHPVVRCLLVGPFDTNPSSLKPSELDPYIKNGIIEYFGEQNDVRPFITQSSVFVLPSYHEGTPKAVLEAMAMGRPIITTDAPGCRETVIDGVNGYLVNVKDTQSLANKMEYFINNYKICKKMGKESIRLVKIKFDVRLINQSIMNVMGLI